MKRFERRIPGRRLSRGVKEGFFFEGGDVEVGWDWREKEFDSEKIVVFWNFLIGGSLGI